MLPLPPKVSLPEDWQLNSSFCNIRQHLIDGNKYILQQIHQNYPIPVTQNPLRSFQLILYLSQVSQAQCVKMQVEFYRRSRNEVKHGEGWTMGALYWQLNDVWQAPSWSSLEYSGKWKMLHYFAKDFFAPVVPILFEDEEDLMVYAVSELNFDLKLILKLTVYQWDSFQPACHLNSSEFLLYARTSQSVLRRPLSTLLESCAHCSPTRCLLTAQLMTSNGIHYGQRNYHFPVPLHRVKGLHGLVKVAAVNPAGPQRFTVVLKASAVSPFVFLDAGTLHGRFEDNGFLMVEPVKSVIFRAWQKTSAHELKRKLTVTSLCDVFQK
uniref:beta-mannosidase-like n=1 Tax=Myxine glutinosa TaxID=7769 RepID=UPI00358FC16E